MTEPRNWSTKTLARQLVAYIQTTNLKPDDSIVQLLQMLSADIVEEEVGTSLDPWAEE